MGKREGIHESNPIVALVVIFRIHCADPLRESTVSGLGSGKAWGSTGIDMNPSPWSDLCTYIIRSQHLHMNNVWCKNVVLPNLDKTLRLHIIKGSNYPNCIWQNRLTSCIEITFVETELEHLAIGSAPLHYFLFLSGWLSQSHIFILPLVPSLSFLH